ncbi:MAG TPA: hypothetical protein VFC68_06400 [Treponemataceae bacterium]|nr:hypothetical protein [Treponemataceae bacterium]
MLKSSVPISCCKALAAKDVSVFSFFTVTLGVEVSFGFDDDSAFGKKESFELKVTGDGYETTGIVVSLIVGVLGIVTPPVFANTGKAKTL